MVGSAHPTYESLCFKGTGYPLIRGQTTHSSGVNPTNVSLANFLGSPFLFLNNLSQLLSVYFTDPHGVFLGWYSDLLSNP